MERLARAGAVLTLAGLAACRPAHAPGPRQTALVDLMVANYARLGSYHDRGVSIEWSARDDAAEMTVSTTEFETFFVRAPTQQLRFAFRSSLADEETILVTRGPEIRIYDHGYEVKSIETLDDAQMRLRSASAGSADIVPTLLRGENPWTCNGEKPKRCDLAGDDWVANVRCTRVVIHRAPCSDVFVCIDEHLMLRKTSDWWRASVERQRKGLQDFIEEHPDHKEALQQRLQSMTSPSTDENTLLFFPQPNASVAPDAFEVDIDGDSPAGPIEGKPLPPGHPPIPSPPTD